MNNRPLHTKKGFTLTELLIATLLMSIVLTGAYTLFNTVILNWRNSSANESTYRDARIIFNLLERDLRSIPSDEDFLDAREFFLGEDDFLEFITLIEPIPSEELIYPRLMRVTYHFEDHRLIREETELESPLPKLVSDTGRFDRDLIEFGSTEEHILSNEVLGWSLEYIWTPVEEEAIQTLYLSESTEYQLPNGIIITLNLHDPAKADSTSATVFSKTIRLFGVSSPIPDYAIPTDELNP